MKVYCVDVSYGYLFSNACTHIVEKNLIEVGIKANHDGNQGQLN